MLAATGGEQEEQERDQWTACCRARINADARLLRILSESAQGRRTAALRYRASDGALTSRDFDVYGNVFRGGRWYVVGHCHLRHGLRTLRLDRVAHAEVGEQPFTRPEGFDAVEYLGRALASVPRGVATELFLYTDLECARRSSSMDWVCRRRFRVACA